MDLHFKGNEKLYLMTISALLITLLTIIYYKFSIEGYWFQFYITALIPNIIASLLTFFVLYFYFGSRLEDNREKILNVNSTLSEEILKSISNLNSRLYYEIINLRNRQNIGEKLDLVNNADNSSKFTINIGNTEQDKLELLKLKQEFDTSSKASQTKISEILDKINNEKNQTEKLKLQEVLSKLIVDNATNKTRLDTIEKIIQSITLSETNKKLQNQIDANNAEIQQLNKKVKEVEQEKIQKDEKLKKMSEYEAILKKKDEELKKLQILSETNSKLQLQVDSQSLAIQQLNKKAKETEQDKIQKDELLKIKQDLEVQLKIKEEELKKFYPLRQVVDNIKKEVNQQNL